MMAKKELYIFFKQWPQSICITLFFRGIYQPLTFSGTLQSQTSISFIGIVCDRPPK